MPDATSQTQPEREPSEQHQTLKFFFTSAEKPKADQETRNPHAKQSTFLPEVVEALRARFGEAVREVGLYANEHSVRVDAARLPEIARFLKEDLGFTYLSDMGGVDRFTEEERFEVFYNLVCIPERKRLRLKVRAEEEDPVVPSLVEIYPAANWNERECWDMFGIRFDGHPDLRRIYLPEDFEYFPLRKEFPLLGIPGSLPLPPREPGGELTPDPFATAHQGRKPKY